MTVEPEGAPDPAVGEEERARAGCYALIGRLFFGPPDANLLTEMQESGTTPEEAQTAGELAEAWRALQEACRHAFPVVVRQEYDTLFGGAGKALVSPYTSRYADELAPDRHLVQLRERLAAWGLGRNDTVFEVEDHVAGVFDVMRHLIEADATLDEQRSFFQEFVYPGAIPLLAAVNAVESAAFYRRVGRFARAFLELEREAFDMSA